MPDQTILQGIVIKHTPVGEYDFAVTILTLERGKISAFARGARKPGNKLCGTVEPFCYGKFTVYEGKSSYGITDADISCYFEEFRKDLDAFVYGTFFLELADYYSRESMDGAELLGLLYLSLKALEKGTIPKKLIRCIYEIRALVIDGEFPGLFSDTKYLPDTEYAVEFIANSALTKLFSFNVSKGVLDEIVGITIRLRHTFIDKPLKSTEMLSLLEYVSL